MVTSPSVPPYGEAGRLEDILEKKNESAREKELAIFYKKI